MSVNCSQSSTTTISTTGTRNASRNQTPTLNRPLLSDKLLSNDPPLTMRDFLRFALFAIPMVILSVVPTHAIVVSQNISNGTSIQNQTNTQVSVKNSSNRAYTRSHYALPQARQVHPPDYGSSSPPDRPSNNTTSPGRRDAQTQKYSDPKFIQIDRHTAPSEHPPLFSRSTGKFQIKRLRYRDVKQAEDLSPRAKATPSPSYSTSVEPHGDGNVKDNVNSNDKRRSPTYYVARPVATPDRQEGQRVKGSNPPVMDFGHPVHHRSIIEPPSNTSNEYPSNRFQTTSDSIRDADC